MSERLLSSPHRRRCNNGLGSINNDCKRDRSDISPTERNGNNSHTSTTKSKRFKTTDDDLELRQLRYSDFSRTNDEVHETILMCPVMKAVIDTEVFQRLRRAKQLGTSEFLYDCADHNRFQHSLGVAHLARRMATHLKEEQPHFHVTHKDVLCVQLAGLLHDVGHGPFSHIYEAFRENVLPEHLERYPHLKQAYRDCPYPAPKDCAHELSSLQMIDALLAELGLQIDLDHLDRPLKQIGDGIDAESLRVFKPPGLDHSVLTSRDWVFVKECILAKPIPEAKEKFGNQFIGRADPTIQWLYDIVSNRHSGLDVDKIDYFARDQLRAMGTGAIDFKMIEDARICPGKCPNPEKCFQCVSTPGKIHYLICYPKKRVPALMSFFTKRYYNHVTIYQHKKTAAAESVLCDILALADPFFRLTSYDGEEEFPISRAVVKPEFLLRLDDSIISLIAHSSRKQYPQQEMEEARNLCRCFLGHNLYKCAVDEPLNLSTPHHKLVYDMEGADIADGMVREVEYHAHKENTSVPEFSHKDFVVKKYCIHYGCKTANPLLRIRIFDEMNERLIGPIKEIPEALQVDETKWNSYCPQELQKVGIRIFVRDPSKKGFVNQVFNQWFDGIELGDQGARIKTPFPNGIPEEARESDDGDNNDSDEGNLPDYASGPVMLSQESFDDDCDDDDDNHGEADRARSKTQSPIPVKSGS